MASKSRKSIVASRLSYSKKKCDLPIRTSFSHNLFENSFKVRKNRAANNSATKTCSTPWFELYAPKNVGEVAIHKRKLQDVKGAIESMLTEDTRTRLLVLSGPSGASKSTLIQQLAQTLIPEYRKKTPGNSTNIQSNFRSDQNIIEYNNIDGSPLSSFQEFLFHAKYRAGSNLSLILIEDMPNIFHNETRELFQQALLGWLYSSNATLPPLVLCLTECELENSSSYGESFGVDYNVTAETVLGNEILSHPKVKRIRFNPINATLMKKHLSKICLQNRELLVVNKKWARKDAFINQLAHSTGDIRSGITTLEFWAKSSREISLDSRENSISYFHSIGRILYGSNDFPDDSEMINYMIDSFTHHFANRNSRLGLLENYGTFNKGNFEISKASHITDSLSIADTLDHVQESLEYAIRSLRFILSNTKTKISTNGKSLYPREWKIKHSEEEFKIQTEDYINVSLYKYDQTRNSKDVALEFGFYDPLIRSAQFYKKKSMMQHFGSFPDQQTIRTSSNVANSLLCADFSLDTLNRIGGDIKMIGSQDNIISDDDNRIIRKQSLAQLKREKSDKLNILIKQRENNKYSIEEEEGYAGDFVDDPIIDSEEENQGSNSFLLEEDDDSVYDQLLDKRKQFDRSNCIDESLSDSDLEIL